MKRYEFSKNEHGLQSAFFNWVRRNIKGSPNKIIRATMSLCHAIPNGLSTKESQKAKMEGLTAGIPDIHLPRPVVQETTSFTSYQCGNERVYWRKDEDTWFRFVPGLYIEMKYGRNTLSTDQKKIKVLLESVGFKYEICYSTEEAVYAVMNYLPYPAEDYVKAEY